jgi:hypothetical protein
MANRDTLSRYLPNSGNDDREFISLVSEFSMDMLNFETAWRKLKSVLNRRYKGNKRMVDVEFGDVLRTACGQLIDLDAFATRQNLPTTMEDEQLRYGPMVKKVLSDDLNLKFATDFGRFTHDATFENKTSVPRWLSKLDDCFAVFRLHAVLLAKKNAGFSNWLEVCPEAFLSKAVQAGCSLKQNTAFWKLLFLSYAVRHRSELSEHVEEWYVCYIKHGSQRERVLHYNLGRWKRDFAADSLNPEDTSERVRLAHELRLYRHLPLFYINRENKQRRVEEDHVNKRTCIDCKRIRIVPQDYETEEEDWLCSKNVEGLSQKCCFKKDQVKRKRRRRSCDDDYLMGDILERRANKKQAPDDLSFVASIYSGSGIRQLKETEVINMRFDGFKMPYDKRLLVAFKDGTIKPQDKEAMEEGDALVPTDKWKNNYEEVFFWERTKAQTFWSRHMGRSGAVGLNRVKEKYKLLKNIEKSYKEEENRRELARKNRKLDAQKQFHLLYKKKLIEHQHAECDTVAELENHYAAKESSDMECSDLEYRDEDDGETESKSGDNNRLTVEEEDSKLPARTGTTTWKLTTTTTSRSLAASNKLHKAQSETDRRFQALRIKSDIVKCNCPLSDSRGYVIDPITGSKQIPSVQHKPCSGMFSIVAPCLDKKGGVLWFLDPRTTSNSSAKYRSALRKHLLNDHKVLPHNLPLMLRCKKKAGISMEGYTYTEQLLRKQKSMNNLRSNPLTMFRDKRAIVGNFSSLKYPQYVSPETIDIGCISVDDVSLKRSDFDNAVFKVYFLRKILAIELTKESIRYSNTKGFGGVDNIPEHVVEQLDDTLRKWDELENDIPLETNFEFLSHYEKDTLPALLVEAESHVMRQELAIYKVPKNKRRKKPPCHVDLTSQADVSTLGGIKDYTDSIYDENQHVISTDAATNEIEEVAQLTATPCATVKTLFRSLPFQNIRRDVNQTVIGKKTQIEEVAQLTATPSTEVEEDAKQPATPCATVKTLFRSLPFQKIRRDVNQTVIGKKTQTLESSKDTLKDVRRTRQGTKKQRLQSGKENATRTRSSGPITRSRAL